MKTKRFELCSNNALQCESLVEQKLVCYKESTNYLGGSRRLALTTEHHAAVKETFCFCVNLLFIDLFLRCAAF